MAILGKIRKQTGLLIGVTAVGLLAFLVPWNSVSDFFTGAKNPNVFGKVNGTAITREEYYGQLNLLSNQYQNRLPQTMIEAQNWQSLITNKLIEQKFNDAGFLLTEDMTWNKAQYSPLASAPQFLDKNGKFSSELAKDYFDNIEKTGGSSVQEYQTIVNLKKGLQQQAMYDQYFGALSAGLLSNSKEAEVQAQNQVNLSNIDYVKIDYNDYLKENKVEVTDADLQAYIDSHKTLFKIEDNRTLDYVFFSAKPTPADEEVSLKSITRLLNSSVIDGDTIKAFGNVKNDSVYIGELRSAQLVDGDFDPTYRAENQLPTAISSWVKSASIGQISAPYKESGYYAISKLVGKKMSDSVTVKSIIISYTDNLQLKPKKDRTKEQAKKQAEELVEKINANPNDFDKLGTEFSDDPSFAQNKGVEYFVTAQPLNPAFQGAEKFINTAPAGKTTLIETPIGYMILNLVSRKQDKMVYKLANLFKEIKASEGTTEKARKEATVFIQTIQGKSSKEFQNSAKKDNYTPIQQTSILRYGSTLNIRTDKDAEIISWAFQKGRNLGDTRMFTTSDESQVVVRVSSLFNKGLMQPVQIRERYENIVRNEKIGKLIAEKVNASAKSLDQLATEYKTQKNSAAISFAASNINGSPEPKVAGAAFGVKEGATSKAIIGNSGVYVITVKSLTKGQMPDKKEIKNQIMSSYSQEIPSTFLQTLIRDAKIDDYRATIMSQTSNQ